MTLLSKANLIASQIMSKNFKFDRGMTGLKVEADGTTIGMDRNIMLVVGPTDEQRLHFPNVGRRVRLGDNGILLEADHVADAIKNLPKDQRVTLQHVALTETDSPGMVELTAKHPNGQEKRSAMRPMNDHYPDWKKMLRKAFNNGIMKDPVDGGDRGVVRACVNRSDLARLLKAVMDACPDRNTQDAPIFLEFGDGIMLRAMNQDTGQHVIGVIKPYKTGGKWMEMNMWEKGLFLVKDAVQRVLRPLRRKPDAQQLASLRGRNK